MIAPRRLALALLPALVACGEATHAWQQRSPDEWVEDLWHVGGEESRKAYEAVVAFGRQDPAAVLGALERRFAKPPPPPTGRPFALRLDAARARRAGLPDVPAPDALVGVLPILRTRLVALGLTPTAIRSRDSGQIDLMAPGDRTREQLFVGQTVLTTTGALDLRIAVRPPGAAGGGPVYQGATPWSDFLAGETAAYLAAWTAEKPYRPSDPRWRILPTTSDPPKGVEDVVLVEEPRDAADTMDERLAARAEGTLAKDGTPVVVLHVRPDRVDDVRRFLGRSADGELVVAFDGVVRARFPVPATSGQTLVLPVGPPGGRAEDAQGWANAHAIYVRTGRLPWPLSPLPLPETWDTAPPADNVMAQAAVALGKVSVPMLERVAQGGLPWARASAEWALARLAETK